MFLPDKHFVKHAFSCDEDTEPAEEPDQRGLCVPGLLVRHEKIRVLVLLVSPFSRAQVLGAHDLWG